MVHEELTRDQLIEWCTLLTGYSKVYFENKSNEELEQCYQEALNKINGSFQS